VCSRDNRVRRKAALPISVDCIKKDLENCIAYMKHPFRRWRHIRTTNIIERGFKEVNRKCLEVYSKHYPEVYKGEESSFLLRRPYLLMKRHCGRMVVCSRHLSI